MPRRRVLAAGVAAAALAACTTSTATPSAAPASAVTTRPAPTEAPTASVEASPSTAGSSVAPPTPGPTVPATLQFSARRLDGGTFEGRDHAGEDVVLWVWAPWCPQCNREASHVARVAEELGDEVTFVGVPGQDSEEAHRAFVREHGLQEMVHVVDDDGSLWAHLGVSYQPAWVLVDDDGTTEVVAGGLYDGLRDRVRQLAAG